MPPVNVGLDALITGATIVMMASGLVLVLSIMGILNWAHGQLYMLAAFITYYMVVRLGMNYILALLVATDVVAAIGVAIERWLLRPLTNKNLLAVSAVALGFTFVFDGGVVIIFGTETKAISTIWEGVLHAGPASISQERLALVIIAIVVMLGLYFFINRTKVGLAIRAAAQEPTVAGLFGVDAGRLCTIVMATGCGLAAIAGGMMAPVYFVEPSMGSKPLILALLAIVLGGLGSFRGAAAGGMILGFITVVVAYYIGPWYELVSFSVIIAIILLRPQGLFGMSEARE